MASSKSLNTSEQTEHVGEQVLVQHVILQSTQEKVGANGVGIHRASTEANRSSWTYSVSEFQVISVGQPLDFSAIFINGFLPTEYFEYTSDA